MQVVHSDMQCVHETTTINVGVNHMKHIVGNFDHPLVENYTQKTAVEIGCGSFDYLDLQPLNNYRFFFSILRLKLLLGCVIYCWKGILKTFPTEYYTPLYS
jgi:hypothetical protein